MNSRSFTGSFAKKQRPSDRKVKIRRVDNLIFITCIIISAVFWSLIKLSEFYSESFLFNVRYHNVPEEKKLTSLDDSTVAITIETRGFGILRMRLFEDMNTLDIDLADFNFDRREGNHFYIYTQEMKEQLSDRFEVAESNFEFSKTTLAFVLEDLNAKKIPVRENLLLNFRQEYYLYEKPTMSPDEVMAYGPENMLDTIGILYTQNIQQSQIDSDITVEVKIANPYPDLLRLSPDAVTISLRVEKYTEGSLEIPVDFSGIKQPIKAFPSTVKVNFQVARKDFTLVQPGQFKVVPETEGVDIQNTDRLHLKLVRQPEIIRNPWIVPAYVEFLIIK